MSYILDALRRADAERRRGQAPALQQVAMPLDGPATGAARSGRSVGLALAVLGLVAAAAGLGWWWGRPSATATPPRVSVASAPMPARLAGLPAASPPSVSPVPVAQPTPPVPAAPVPQPRSEAPQAPPPVPAAAPSPAPAPAPSPAPPPAAAPEALPTAPPPSPAATTAPRPLAVSALPEPRRSAVTGLAFGGVVQSQDRSQSFVLLAGQIVREGDPLAPGIVLERIGARTLLLRVDGQLVELPL